MILSTILLNIIGIFEVDYETRSDINVYKSTTLYDEAYKQCAKGHFATKVFGEPLSCLNDTFLMYSLDQLGARPTQAESPDMTHLVRQMHFEDPHVISAELISNKQGQVIRLEARLSDELKMEDLREVAKKISKLHGQPDVNPPNPQMPMWGWITQDGFEIRLYTNTINGNRHVSITQHQSHGTLRDLKTKTVK